MWQYRGQKRPSFAIPPEADQESVWDYPRPPRVEQSHRLVEVFDRDTLLARTHETYRVLETGSPPTIYIPDADIDWSQLVAVSGTTICEWKGVATYWGLAREPDGAPVAWSYPDPYPAFAMLRAHTTFYPERVACFIDGERVLPQPGEYYGGWVTAEIVGPFKGEPGTGHW